MNGANEEAVRAFLNHRIPFTGIARVLSRVLTSFRKRAVSKVSLDAVLAADAWARRAAIEVVESFAENKKGA
jgi:1-deoxy-D-xylulose-5-phosphate reductoisomerase